MSALLKAIAADQLAARKAGDKLATAALTTLLSESSKLTAEDFGNGVTEVSDGRVIATVKNFISNASQTLELTTGNKREDLVREIEIYSKYVPTQLTEGDLSVIIHRLKEEGMNLGQIMAKLKADYDGQYDGKLASTLARG